MVASWSWSTMKKAKIFSTRCDLFIMFACRKLVAFRNVLYHGSRIFGWNSDLYRRVWKASRSFTFSAKERFPFKEFPPYQVTLPCATVETKSYVKSHHRREIDGLARVNLDDFETLPRGRGNALVPWASKPTHRLLSSVRNLRTLWRFFVFLPTYTKAIFSRIMATFIMH